MTWFSRYDVVFRENPVISDNPDTGKTLRCGLQPLSSYTSWRRTSSEPRATANVKIIYQPHLSHCVFDEGQKACNNPRTRGPFIRIHRRHYKKHWRHIARNQWDARSCTRVNKVTTR